MTIDDATLQDLRLAALGYLTAQRMHELNNLVMVMTGHIELMQQLPDAGTSYLDKCKKAAWRTSDVQRQLMALAVEPGNQLAWTDLLEVIESLYQRRIETETVAVSCTAPADLPVSGDPLVVGQVVAELLANALEAMAGTGEQRLTITVSQTADGQVLRMQDTGRGLTPNELAQAFAADWHGEGERRRPTIFLRAGNGLPRCRRIIELFGGRLKLTGAPGAGAEAVVTLPPAAPLAPT